MPKLDSHSASRSRRRLSSAVQNPLETYLREINETALLTADQEKELSYRINDGEGLRHEAHFNSAVKDSRLIGNKGNAYLSSYRVHGIDGRLIRGNDVRVPKGIEVIFVVLP